MNRGNLTKKLIALIISLCMIVLPFNGVYAKQNNQSKELELVGILKDADKIELIQNDDKFGIAYAVFGDLKNIIKWNKKTNEVQFSVENLKTRGKVNNSTFNINIDENFEPIGFIKYNDEAYDLSNIDVNDNSRAALALPAIVGAALIKALIAASATVVILGVTYVLATEIASTLRKKSPKHYQAAIRWSSKLKRNELFIGNSLGETGASGRMRAGNDVWSTSKYNAQKIAKLAGNGINYDGPERHGNGKPGYYWHYHAVNNALTRVGGHSFY